MKKAVFVATAVLALSAAGSVAYLSRHSAPAAEAPAPPPASPGVPVTAGTVTAADMPVLLNAIGTVQAFNNVTIKSRVDGQIVKIQFNEGQDVKAGAPLLQIDPRPYQAAVEQAQAAKEKDQAQLAMAQQDLARWSGLVASGYKSRQTLEQTQAQAAQLHASIKGDEAQINNARLNLEYAEIRAPIDGRLGARLVDVGNMVRANDAAGLVTIAQLNPIFVSFTVPQEHLHKIREKQAGGPLLVQTLGGDNKTLLSEGKLTVIDNAVDQPTGTIRLKARFANADEQLWPGEFVNVRLVLMTRKGVPTVPAQTVQAGPGGSYAYVIKSDSTVERRPVEIAAVQDGVAVIATGLSPGDQVVVEGQYRLTNGARVRVAQPGTGSNFSAD